MSLVGPDRAVQPASLVGGAPAAIGCPGLDRVGARLAKGLAGALSGLMSAPATVTLVETRSVDGRDPDSAFRTLRISPWDGLAGIAIARESVLCLVDRYYGGDGRAGAGDLAGLAGERLLDRIALLVASILPAAWHPAAALTATLEESQPDEAEAAVSQSFAVACDGWPDFRLDCRYPAGLIEALAASEDGNQAASPHQASQQWAAELRTSLLAVGLPVKAVFAEPALPLATLLALRVGDIIPICLPGTIGLTVAGRAFARGSAGDANGRAAIRIDTI